MAAMASDLMSPMVMPELLGRNLSIQILLRTFWERVLGSLGIFLSGLGTVEESVSDRTGFFLMIVFFIVVCGQSGEN